MTTMTATAARDNFAEVVNRAGYRGERIALERHGKTVAAIISAEDLALLEALEDRLDLAAARKALKEPRRSWDEVKAELGL